MSLECLSAKARSDRLGLDLGLGMALGVAALACDSQAVRITPNHGPLADASTVVSEQHFGAGGQVAIDKGTWPSFADETGAAGSFIGAARPIVGPAPVSGMISNTAIGRRSGPRATRTFTVAEWRPWSILAQCAPSSGTHRHTGDGS
jgi:hypothetical protein